MTIANYSYLSMVDPWPLSANVADTINPGDMLYWDSATRTNRPLTDPTKGQLFSGIALGSYPPTSNVDNGITTPPAVVPASLGDLHQHQGTVGDTVTHGDALYLGADQQTVTNQAPGGTDINDVIGFAFFDDQTTQVVVAAGDLIQWRPVVNFPSPYLAK